MSSCHTIDLLVTPYVDGDIGDADRRAVDEHLRQCPPCHSRVTSERAVRETIRTCRVALADEQAPASLRARCQASSRQAPVAGHQSSAWRSRVVPFAIAASLLLVVASALLYQLT